jgi:copper transport protein
MMAVIVAVLGVIGWSVSPALAHAELTSTDPVSGSVLDAPPDAVTLSFSEAIDIGLGAVRLFDGRGRSVDVGAATHPDGRASEVRIDVPDLPNGSYVVDWRVVSADGHPIRGAFMFQVGPTSDLQQGMLDQILGRSHTGRSAGIALSVGRAVVIASMAVVFGGLVVVALGIVAPTRRVRLLLIGGSVAGAAFGLLQLPFEVGYATGRSLGVVFDGDAWSAAFDTRVGSAWVGRACLIAVAGIGLTLSASRRTATAWVVAVIAAAVGAGVVSAYGGHGATGRWVPVGILATALHVVAMAIWLGGLVVVLVELRSVGGNGVHRFSNLALGMVAVVVVSGVVQSLRQLDSFDALTDTDYGALLIWKVVAVCALLAVASLSRRLVHARRASRSPDEDATIDDIGRLRRTIAIEVVIAVAIVSLTSLLMAENPAATAAGRPFSTQLIEGGYLASITIDPGRVGANEMHLYLSDAASSLSQPDEVTVEISDPSRDVAPIRLEVARSGAGHFTAYGAVFPYAADWTLTVRVRYGSFDEIVFTATVQIG